MKDIRIEKFAKLLVNYSLNIQEKEMVWIESTHLAEPLVKEIYKETLKKGAYPDVYLMPSFLRGTFYKHANSHQLNFVSPLDSLPLDRYTTMLTIQASYNTKELSNTDPKIITAHSLARKTLTSKFMEKVAKGALKWCGTLFPTPAYAQESEMSLEEYEDFVFTACHLDKEDPIAEWQKISKEQQKIIEKLENIEELHILSKDTDLKMKVKGRRWINCDGKENMPDGEIFTSPLEDTVEGKIRFTYPAIYAGREVKDVFLTFEKGRIITAKAEKGEDFLTSILEQDEGAKYVGEISIATNYSITKFTKNILFDEKIGGTIHLAIGASIQETGGKNIAAIHWDMVCDMKECGEIYADGKLIYKNGKFII